MNMINNHIGFCASTEWWLDLKYTFRRCFSLYRGTRVEGYRRRLHIMYFWRTDKSPVNNQILSTWPSLIARWNHSCTVPGRMQDFWQRYRSSSESFHDILWISFWVSFWVSINLRWKQTTAQCNLAIGSKSKPAKQRSLMTQCGQTFPPFIVYRDIFPRCALYECRRPRGPLYKILAWAISPEQNQNLLRQEFGNLAESMSRWW